MYNTSKDRLKKILKDKHISQRKLSDLIGYKYEYVNAIINKDNVFTEKHARLFASALGCNTNYLLLRSDIPYINGDMVLYGDAFNLVSKYLDNENMSFNDVDIFSGALIDKDIFITDNKTNNKYIVDPGDLSRLLSEINVCVKAFTDNMLLRSTKINK